MEKKILVVEDSQALAMAYSLPFVRKGYEVEIAIDGRKALELLRSFQPDLVLLDLILPKVRGNVILEAIRSNPDTEKLPVIIFTNALLRPDEETRIRRQATRFLHKAQTSPEQIVKVVEELLLAAAPATESGIAQIEPVMQAPAPLAPALNPVLASQPDITPAPAVETFMAAPLIPAAPPSTFKEEPAQVAEEPIAKPEEPMAHADDAVVPEVATTISVQPDALIGVGAIFKEIESLIRKLMAEQNEGVRDSLLAKLIDHLHGLDQSIFSEQAGALGRLFTAFDALASELLHDAKNRSPGSIRTLMQALPILKHLYQLAQTTGQVWEPILSKILVVDDSAVSLKSVTKALSAIQLDCQAVANPLEALRLLETNAYDLVILDVDMPEMSGTDVCRKLRAMPLHAKTPVIFLTSLNRFDVRLKTSQSGGDDFVSKPFAPSKLAVKVLTHVLRRNLEPRRS